MSFDHPHSESQCDKCGKKVGKAYLHKLPFAYLDCNDRKHTDISEELGYPKGTGYRQYWVCQSCLRKGV